MRLVVVSNRLPMTFERRDHKWHWHGSSGGLVTAVAPVLRNRGGLWIGWPGALEEDGPGLDECLKEVSLASGYNCRAVHLTDDQRELFYYGFSNQTLWPLFHNLDERCNFDPAFWAAFENVNGKFAESISHHVGQNEEDFIWIHDYQLMLVGYELRRQRCRHTLGFFLHIPFPPLDIFMKLPWRFHILRGLLAYDLLGFQTVRDRRNFMECVRTLLKEVSISGRGRIQRVQAPGQVTKVGTFPISIDYDDFAEAAARPEVEAELARLRSEFADRFVLLGLDRLDYTKGVPHRLRALRHALSAYPELRRRISMVQVLVPSREAIRTYQSLKNEIDELVGNINGEFGEPGWAPVQYLFRHLNRTELLAYYRMAGGALITPVNDGMNLVAKEYCASDVAEQGVLILSEFAGAAAELQGGALLVNPHDVVGTAEAILRAYTMDSEERRRRMRIMRRVIQQHNITWWVNSFLKAGADQSLNNFPEVGLYVPQDDHTAILPGNPPAPAAPLAHEPQSGVPGPLRISRVAPGG